MRVVDLMRWLDDRLMMLSPRILLREDGVLGLNPGKLRWVPLSQADTESSAIMTSSHRTALAASLGRLLDHGMAHGYTAHPALVLDLAMRLGFSRKEPIAPGVREARLCDVQEACDALARMPPSDLERVSTQYGR